MNPLLLDLFCGAGGAGKGYTDAGFDVVGVDITPQPNYPFIFRKFDAVDYLTRFMDLIPHTFTAVHASPPCQVFSKMTGCRPGLADEYDDLIEPVRGLLEQTGLPYVIENVPGSPLKNPTELCGTMFGYELYRHRHFETNWPLTQLGHPPHVKPGGKAGHWKPGQVISITGHCSPMWLAREVMAIPWMRRHELVQAIPPYYTQFVGSQLLQHLSERKT